MSYWYLATPYSRAPMGHAAAYETACALAARLIRAGMPVLSPIAHSHGIAAHGNLPAVDDGFWARADAPLLDAARGLVVAQIPGWDASTGVAHEIAVCQGAGKPVVYWDPERQELPELDARATGAGAAGAEA